jgi:hypothetical protein
MKREHSSRDLAQSPRQKIKREPVEEEEEEDEEDGEATETAEEKKDLDAIVIVKNRNALLTLYTDVNHWTGEMGATRSVLLVQQSPTSVCLLDNLQWVVYISVPLHVDPALFKKFMINSYCAMHYVHPYANQHQQQQQEALKSGMEQRSHSLYETSCKNRMISGEIKDMLALLDDRNNTRYAEFVTRCAPKRHSRWKKKNQWKRRRRRSGDDDDLYSDDEDDDEAEENEAEEQPIYPCSFDRDVDIVHGLYDGDYRTGQLQNHRSGDADAKQDMDYQCINGEMWRLYGREAMEKRFAGQKQYRLTFNNHYIAHYFVSRFMRKPVTLKLPVVADADTAGGERPSVTFTVGVLQYVADAKNVRALVPLNKLYVTTKTATSKEYIEGQMYHFRGGEQDTVAYRFSSPKGVTTPPSVQLYAGLLHPSYLESYAGVGNSAEATRYYNIYDSVDVARRVPANGSDKIVAYQTLYVDLATLAPYNGIQSIQLFDYRQRKLTVAPKEQMSAVLHTNGLTTKDVQQQQQQQGGNGESMDVVRKTPVNSSNNTTTTVVTRVVKEKKPIKNQPKLGDFMTTHQIKLMDEERTRQLEEQMRVEIDAASTGKKKTKKKKKADDHSSSHKSRSKQKKRQKQEASVRDKSLFFQPYVHHTLMATAAEGGDGGVH